MLKLIKKSSNFSKFIFFYINNTNLFFSKIWINGLLGVKILYLPTEINFLYQKFYYYLLTIFVKQSLTVFFSFIKNLVTSVLKGFKKYLRIRGLGFKVFKEKSFLKFQLGYSHLISYKTSKFLNFKIIGTKARILKISGLSLDQTTQTSFLIKTFRKPGVYKQKGIYFTRELVKLKAGKKKKFR